jgi:hypothetical protein
MESQVALLVAVQLQPLAVVTETVPLVAASLKLALDGDIVLLHVTPA